MLPSLGQLGVQTQVPSTQRPFVPQFIPPQSQVLMQRPLLQTLPAAQVTPEQRFSTHWPLTQTWLPEHWTLAQGSAAVQVVLQASPDGQLMVLQLLSLVHFPLLLSQNCPEAQVTPLHGAGKHPATQLPPMQVSSLAQLLPAQRSVTGTQAS